MSPAPSYQQSASTSGSDHSTLPDLGKDLGQGAPNDPLALAQALLTQAETAPDPAPLIAAAKALVQAAQASKDVHPGSNEAAAG